MTSNAMHTLPMLSTVHGFLELHKLNTTLQSRKSYRLFRDEAEIQPQVEGLSELRIHKCLGHVVILRGYPEGTFLHQ